MIRDVDIIEFLPPYLQEYEALEQICTVENPEIQVVEDETEILKENQFILTCNEDGIARWEQLLSLSTNPEDTLEMRISRVLIKWSDTSPYTYSVLIEKLNTLIGDENYSLFPEFENYRLGVHLTLENTWIVDEVVTFLRGFVPANLVLDVINIKEFNVDLALSHYSCMGIYSVVSFME